MNAMPSRTSILARRFSKSGRIQFHRRTRSWLATEPPTGSRLISNTTRRRTMAALSSTDGNRVDHVMEDDIQLPFPAATFDLVVSGQVLEHVRRVWIWFEEVARVTKPGGYVVTICPVSWPYHEAPVDC